MTKVWVDRAYLAFIAVAACLDVLLLIGYFVRLPNVPDVVGAIAILGFLNFLTVFWQLAGWSNPVLEPLTIWFQLTLSLAVMTLLVWGVKRGWRTKLLIMVGLTAPGVVLCFT
jgi:hypothetical protein